MNREIKFRAWLPNECKMTKSHSLKDIVSICSLGYPDDAIWLQSIYIKDNQGKEYFFDDIVKFPDDSIGVLVWFGDCLGIGSGQINNYHATDQVRECELSDCEIIGNIHQNPELLNY